GRKLFGKGGLSNAERGRKNKVMKKKGRVAAKTSHLMNKQKSLPASEKERIAYYKKKYGENFTSKTGT
ncbi:MAG: hypothetical protein QGG87_05950, partial [Nitrospinota bacterium]|nr:hypothetical protein [Nitrospinota bacterium]